MASPEFMLLGNQWCMRLYPGGYEVAAEDKTSLFLCNMSDKAIDIDYGFSVNDENGKQVVYERSATLRNFTPLGTVDNARGWPNFATRTTLLSSLVNGTLVIKVCLRLAKPTKFVSPPFIPENPFAKNIQRMIIDENFGDISFVVGGNQKKNNAKKSAKTNPVMFHAHRDILRECSTGILADICGSEVSKGVSMSSPVEITDVSPEVFRHLIYSAYGGKISADDMKPHTKEIIEAANRYEELSI